MVPQLVKLGSVWFVWKSHYMKLCLWNVLDLWRWTISWSRFFVKQWVILQANWLIMFCNNVSFNRAIDFDRSHQRKNSRLVRWWLVQNVPLTYCIRNYHWVCFLHIGREQYILVRLDFFHSRLSISLDGLIWRIHRDW